MINNNSITNQSRYEKLRENAQTLFDLQWLREESAQLLLNQLPKDQPSAWQALCLWDQSCRENDLTFFAHQLLTTYAEALKEVSTIVDEEMDIETLEEEMCELLQKFSQHNAGKSWQAVSVREDAQERTRKWHMSARIIFSKCRLHTDFKDFFLLLNYISILNDVMHGKAIRHGLKYSKKSTLQSEDPVEVFCQHLTDIVDAAAQLNGQQVKTKAKGQEDTYTFNINAQAFNSMIQELRSEYRYKVEDYLGDRDATQVCQLQLVCPFLGFVLDTHLITPSKMQKKDLVPVLKQFYPGMSSIAIKLSSKNGTPAEESLFRMVESLLKERTKK